MKDTHKFQVFADYHQFYLMDAGIDPIGRRLLPFLSCYRALPHDLPTL